MTLLERTQELLTERRQVWSLTRIAQESRGAVDREWLIKFARGAVEDPGVNRVQRLHDFLKSIPNA
jgi:hypothetical protein